MVVDKNLCYNFLALKWIFRLPWYPLQLEYKTSKLSLHPETHRRHGLWRLYKSLLVAHWFFIVGRAVHLKLAPSGKQHQAQLPFVLTFCLFNLSAVYASFTLFSGSRRYLNIKLFNELFYQTNVKENGEGDFEKSSSRKETSYLLFVVRFIPFLLYGFLIFYPIMYKFNPEFSTLIISVVNPAYRNLLTIGFCLCLELMIQFQFLFTAQFVALCIITFITRFMEKTDHQKCQLRKFRELEGFKARFQSPFSVYKSLYQLNLLLSLFNLCFSDIFFFTKIVCLGGAISGGFSAIRFIRRKPALGIISLLRVNNSVTVAKGIFDNAYQISTRIEDLKHECVLCSSKILFIIKRRENRMRVRAIPRMGIKIGGFYKVEREATPIFVDFVCTQISSLLIAFQ